MLAVSCSGAPASSPGSQLLKHLTAKRAVSVDRAEFYVHAEAFAALVALEIVAMQVGWGWDVQGWGGG